MEYDLGYTVKRAVGYDIEYDVEYAVELKAAEECFRQVKEKATYSVKPKHASGIVKSEAGHEDLRRMRTDGRTRSCRFICKSLSQQLQCYSAIRRTTQEVIRRLNVMSYPAS
ncbi:formin-2 isoform X2 [Labeo rohita]|uniref:Formin-2 isoform X2 n=1 Tax=Labeo rohita TaxID=84645 RepID=A0A498LKM1_LABRO|nr:formin-2 isoform X2 [Labeo rohita]